MVTKPGHLAAVREDPGTAVLGLPVGWTRGASGWGSAGWGCRSGFRVGSHPLTQKPGPAGNSIACRHGKAQGKGALCPGWESHWPIRVPLWLSSAATHRRRSAASLPLVAWHGMLPACSNFCTLSICPMSRGLPGCPQAMPTLPAMCCSSRTQGRGWQGLWDPHVGQHWWLSRVTCASANAAEKASPPPPPQSRAPYAAPSPVPACLPPAPRPPWLWASALAPCLHAAWRRFRPNAWFPWQL